MRRFIIRFTEEAEQDLIRLYDFLAEVDAVAADRALEQIGHGIELLRFTPYSCRRAVPDMPNLRELIIPFGKRGYVALFDIEPPHVTILAVRHQREDDI